MTWQNTLVDVLTPTEVDNYRYKIFHEDQCKATFLIIFKIAQVAV